MDYQKLLDAAHTGNVEQLQKSLQENPLILTEISLLHESEDTILHIATKAGHLNFVSQILKHIPELARESKNDRHRPLDIAAAVGNVEIVKEFLKNDREICRLKGRDERCALHFAAAGGRIGVIDEVLSACFECIKDVTVLGETALHVAVKNNKYEAFGRLVKWVERLGMEEIINWRDCDGNTVLHLATCRKQIESVKILLGKSNSFNGLIEVNVRNSKGLTAMDILDILIENPSDLQLREILRRAGAVGALPDATALPSSTPSSFQEIKNNNKSQQESAEPLSEAPSINWFKPFGDSTSATGNALLVVVALIATVTFQAGINPPPGLLENRQSNTTTSSKSQEQLESEAITFLFIFGNTLGLSASLSIISYLTVAFPYQRELLTSIFGMMFTYGLSISSIAPNNGVITRALQATAFFLPFSLRLLPRWGKKAWKWWRTHSTTTVSARKNEAPILP